MSNKFNTNVLTDYSKAFARRVAAEFYQHHSVISGKQILSLTPIGQVNLFVISSLSDKWRTDAEKFRSPYFDFAHPDVQEALRTFMNVVSQHISVRREHVEPLLVEATKRTLTLLFDPRFYFDEILRDQPEFTLTADAARQLTRYTQIHKVIPATIERKMNGKPFVYANQALGFLDEVLTQRTHELDHYDRYVALFSEKVPLDLAALFRSHVPDAFPGQGARSFFDTEVGTDNVVAPASQDVVNGSPASPPEVVPTNVVEPAEETGGPLFLEERSGPEPTAPIAQPTVMPTGSISQPTDAVTVNDRLREDVAPATTSAPAAGATSVGEAFSQAPIESITRSISLNQKFRFINQLFNGNTAAYNQAIDELDRMSNYGQALDLISYRYASQFLWDMSSDEVSELVDILKRRFS